jgi:hypothetical protein
MDGSELGVAGTLAQFGVAGIMGAMWLIERRASAKREEQLTQAHEKLIGQIEDRRTLIELVRDNTRALSLLETGQRGLLEVLRTRVVGSDERV